MPDVSDAAVLDLFAGTGALGIEALSRGAASAVFVERARPALAALQANLDELGLASSCRVLRNEVRVALTRLARERERFALIFMDPPYGSSEGTQALLAVAKANLLAPEGTLVLETAWRHAPGDVPGLLRADERRYGETLVVCFRAGSAESGESDEPGKEPAA